MSSSQRKITFKNKKNELIQGILRQHNITKPLLVICHGYGVSIDHPALQLISTSLYRSGHNVFIFNFSKRAQKESLEQQVDDIESVVEHFTEYTSVILLAGSLGALSASIAAPHLKKVKGLITVNGFFGEWKLGLKLFTIYAVFHLMTLLNKRNKQILNYMKSAYRPADISIPTLVIHSQSDKDVSIKQSEHFYNLVKGKKTFYILHSADHQLLKDGAVEVVEIIDNWLPKAIE